MIQSSSGDRNRRKRCELSEIRGLVVGWVTVTTGNGECMVQSTAVCVEGVYVLMYLR